MFCQKMCVHKVQVFENLGGGICDYPDVLITTLPCLKSFYDILSINITI